MDVTEKSRKRQRGPNFSQLEKETLVLIIEDFKTILENKKTDSISNEEKEMAWKKVADLFNAQNTTHRSVETLKVFYNNMKKNLKKKEANYRKEMYLTGGGSAPKDLTDIEKKLLTIVNKKSIYGLKNNNDSDATDFNQENNINEQILSSSSDSEDASNIRKKLKILQPSSSRSDNDQKSQDKNNLEIIVEEDPLIKATEGSSLNPKEKPKKKLDRRRPIRRPQNAVRALTSSEIGEKYNCLVEKKLSLVEKLNEEHNLRMEALKLEIELKKKLLNN